MPDTPLQKALKGLRGAGDEEDDGLTPLQRSLQGLRAAAPAPENDAYPSFIDYQPPAVDPRTAQLEEYLAVPGPTGEAIDLRGSQPVAAEAMQDAVLSQVPRLAGIGGMQPTDDFLEYSKMRAAEASQRSPVASTLGGVALDVGAGAMAAPVATGFGLGAGTAGAVQSGLDTLDQTGGDWRRAAGAAALGGTLAKGGELLGRGLQASQRDATALAPELDRIANTNRVAATGQYGASLDALRAQKGEPYIQQLGQDIESAGLHDRPGLLGMFPGWASRYAKNGQALAEAGGARMRGAEDAINALDRPPTIDVGDTIESQAAKAANARSLVDPSAPSEANFRQGFADNLMEAGGANGELPFDEALRQRRALDRNIDWEGRGGYEGAAMQEQARREVAGDLRRGLETGLDDSVAAGDVPYGMANDWKMGRDEFALGREVADPATSRMYRESGNQLGSLPTKNLLGNPVAAIGSELMKYGGRSAVAGGARGMANAARSYGANDMIDMYGEYLQSGARAGLASSAGSAPLTPSREDRLREATLAGNGSEVAQTIKDVLYTQPEALGPYRGDFEHAGRDPIGIAALLNRLKTDNRWTSQYLPMFQGAR